MSAHEADPSGTQPRRLSPGSSGECLVMRVARILVLLGAAAALVGIWFPELHHYSVTSRRPDAAEAMRLRTVPAGLDFASSADADFGLLVPMSGEEFIVAARNMLEGRLEIPGYPARRLQRLFDPDDLTGGTSREQLGYASFVVPDVLTRAYQISRDDRYLLAARDFILGWGRYERQQLLPKGELWGDHAVANRALVLTRFWSAYRNHQSWNEDDARAILEQVVHVASMLATDRLFTARTNHGVMQNVGLLELATAFPVLPESQDWQAVATHRLGQQLAFYVSEEGVVLEHSAGYHVFGTHLLGFALELMRTAGSSIPSDWQRKHERAAHFENLLVRPDGSLPAFGDTVAFDVRRSKLAAQHPSDTCTRASSADTYPLSSYAVWWSRAESASSRCDLRQLVAVWSRFATNAHKHPDEMSLLFWAGVPWWSSVGYWPYDSPERVVALTWTGSNAPHALGESAKSASTTRVVSSAAQPGLRFLELRREIEGMGSLTRQVVEVDGRLWLVVDSSQGNFRSSIETIWNGYRDAKITPAGEAAFWVESSAAAGRLALAFASSARLELNTWQGSHAPFLGWIAGQGDVPEVVPVPAISVHARSNSATATAWTIRDATAPFGLSASLVAWQGESTWKISIGDGEQQLTILRGPRQLSIARAGRPAAEATLQSIPDPVLAQERVNDAYRSLADAYPYFRELLPWRWKATVVLLMLAGAALLAQRLLQRWRLRVSRPAVPWFTIAHGILVAGFALSALWLVCVYLQS
jgi:Heparinase II/III N-terminus